MNHLDLLQECRNQLVYLNEKFGETLTSNALIDKLTLAISTADKQRVLNPEPSLQFRPQWLTPAKEQQILEMYKQGLRLQAVKELWNLAKKLADNDFYGLKWSKDYLDFQIGIYKFR
jgi:hypothetical protein